MDLDSFAETYRLHTRRDSSGDTIIPGRPRKVLRQEDRSHIYDHGDGSRLGVCLLTSSVSKWNNARKRLTALGLTTGQNGDTEGTMLFDPADDTQARAAIREAGICYRKVLTEADRAARAVRARLISGRQTDVILAV